MLSRLLGRTDDHTTDLSMDDVLDVLSNERRRVVIRELATVAVSTPERMPVQNSHLSRHVASIEYGKTIRELDNKEYKRVHISLHQCHLPMMDRLDVVRYDDRNRVHVTPATRELSDLLEHLESVTGGGDS